VINAVNLADIQFSIFYFIKSKIKQKNYTLNSEIIDMHEFLLIFIINLDITMQLNYIYLSQEINLILPNY
jgi:hypothetical protein